MTGERHGCLMTSVVMLACWWTLRVEPVEGSPTGQYHKPWESWDDFFGHSFRKEEPADGSDDVSAQSAGCLPDCEQEGAFYPDGTSCNHFFVCTNNFEVGDKSPRDLFREPTMRSELHSLDGKGSETLDQGSDDLETLSLVRCSCPGKRDVYNRYLQRCSRRGHCRVSCTAQGNIFGNWTSVTYNGYQCSVASLSTGILVDSSSIFHTTSKALGNGESAAFGANQARGNLPTGVYQIETMHPELSEGAEYTHGPPNYMDHVTSVPLSSAILNIQTYTSASVIISATVLPATIQLPIVLSETTQFPVTQPSQFQETGNLTGTNDATAAFQEITHDIQPETISMQDTFSVTISAVTTKPGTIKTPILLPTQTFSPDHVQITITPDISPFITQKPLTLPAHIPVTEDNHRPATLPATIQTPAPDTFPAISQKPAILPATILKPAVLPATIQKPAILPGTIQMSTVLPAPVQTPITLPEIIPKPAVFPEITEMPIPLPATSQTPTVLPVTIQKPVVLPELIQKPLPLPATSQIPIVLPATIQKPAVLPEPVSNTTDLTGINQLPAILPETIQMPSEVSSITPSLLPATILTPATLPLAITEPGSMSEQTSLIEISLTPSKLPDFQDPSTLPASNPNPVIQPATIQKPVTLPAIIQTVSTSLESGQTSDMTSSITQIPVLLPATIETLQTSRPLTMVNMINQTVMTLPATVQPSFTQTEATQKPVILPETIGTFTSSSSSLPLVTLPGIIQTTQISPSFTQGSVSSGMTQMHFISSTNQVTPIQSLVILPTASLMGESSSTMLPQAMQTSTPLPTGDLKPANCRPVKCRVANTRFPNPKDCTRYYKCVMHRGKLVARPYICPSVMPTFSPSLMMCLRGIKCRTTCRDEEVPEISSSSIMTTRIDNMQG